MNLPVQLDLGGQFPGAGVEVEGLQVLGVLSLHQRVLHQSVASRVAVGRYQLDHQRAWRLVLDSGYHSIKHWGPGACQVLQEKEGKPDFTVRVNLANIERKSDVN